MAAWRCPICLVFFALTLRILITHVNIEHCTTPGCVIPCGVDGCPMSYTRFNSFYRHVHRDHKHRLDVPFEFEHTVTHTDEPSPELPLAELNDLDAEDEDMEISGPEEDIPTQENDEGPVEIDDDVSCMQDKNVFVSHSVGLSHSCIILNISATNFNVCNKESFVLVRNI
jgi:hypothetical protein